MPELEPQNPKNTVWINRFKLLGLFAMVFVPMVAATSMYFGGWGVPSGSTNRGELIWPPINITELQATDPQGQPLSHYFSLDEPDARPLKWDKLSDSEQTEESESQWVLLVTGNDGCTEVCQQALYTVRQVNVALGKEAERVSRVLASREGDSQSGAAIARQYPLLSLMTLDTESLATFGQGRFTPANSVTDAWNIWVVDPLGNVILRYEAERHGSDILKDLKRLLKLSNIG